MREYARATNVSGEDTLNILACLLIFVRLFSGQRFVKYLREEATCRSGEKAELAFGVT